MFLSVVYKLFTCYYFTKLLDIHTGKGTHVFFYTWSTCCSEGLQYLVLHLPEQPYSGLVGELDYSPIFILMCLSQLAVCPIRSFFYKV